MALVKGKGVENTITLAWLRSKYPCHARFSPFVQMLEDRNGGRRWPETRPIPLEWVLDTERPRSDLLWVLYRNRPSNRSKKHAGWAALVRMVERVFFIEESEDARWKTIRKWLRGELRWQAPKPRAKKATK